MTQNQEEEKEKLLKNEESRKKQNRQQDEGISTNTNWIYLLASLISLLSVQSNLAVRNEGSKKIFEFEIISETFRCLYSQEFCHVLPQKEGRGHCQKGH